MATLPRATTVVEDTAGAVASGQDLLVILAPVRTSADAQPRVFGSAQACYDQHGYSEGVEYAALHVEQTRKSFMFCGLAIETEGTVGRHNTSGNTGTCVTTVTASAGGCMGEHDGVLTVITGGTIGTDQIVLGLSLDGGRVTKRVRLGTANSYAIPYINCAIAFGAGTLVAGDMIHTWHGTAPRAGATAIQAAREALAAQSKLFRSALLIGDLQDSDDANDFLTQLDAYETANERFIYGRASVYDREPLAEMSHVTARMTGGSLVSFTEVGASGDLITRGGGSFLTDGFAVGDTIRVTGTVSNNITTQIASLAATQITLGTTDLVDEATVSNVTLTSEPTLTFAEVGATGDTITRNRGSWLDDGFRVGDRITVAGTASNNFTNAPITAVTATVLTLDTQDLVAEVVGVRDVTITAGQTKAAWMAEIDAEFESVDDAFRISLGAGRGRVLSPFSGWRARRPVQWAASIREYQNDIHIAPWRKGDGSTGFDLFDSEENLAEWDDRVDGGAGCAARFTTFRTWANGPAGAFLSLSLTRASEGSLLAHTHNAAVTNAVCTIVQLNTEDAAIGESLILNDDGTATADSLNLIQAKVNRQLDALQPSPAGQGQRFSKAVWAPDADTLFNVAEPVMTGVTDLVINGTVHSVRTAVRVR
jgi:hypothetical protein